MARRNFKTFRDVLDVVDNAKARFLLRNFNFMNSGQPPSVGGLAQNLGFEIEFRELQRDVSGWLESEPFAENGWKIVVNKAHPTTRQRWTALHEIAHYFLHPHYLEPLAPTAHRSAVDGVSHFYSSNQELEEEREANDWVEALVFGQSALPSMKSLFGKNERELARHFGVSIETLRIAIRRRT